MDGICIPGKRLHVYMERSDDNSQAINVDLMSAKENTEVIFQNER